MSRAYKKTLFVNNKHISEEIDGDATIQSLMEAGAYVDIIDENVLYTLFLGKLDYQIAIGASDGLNTSVSDFVSEDMTDLIRDSILTTNVIPLRNLETRAFHNRITTKDPHAEASYTVQYTSFKTPDVRDDIYTSEFVNDLVIASTKDSLANSIVSVNGCIHRSVLHGGEVFVAGGYANMKRSQASEISIMNTTSVGGHTAIPITEEMIIPITDVALNQGFRLRLPEGYTLTGKTLFLVIHGRLFLPGTIFRALTPTVINVKSNRFDIVRWVMHHPMTKYSRAYRAPGYIYPQSAHGAGEDPLPALYDDENPIYADPIDVNGIVDASTILGDAFITNLLTDGHSQLILINNNLLYRKSYVLSPVSHPGRYEYFGEDTPRGILLYNGDLALPYTILTAKDRQHTVTVAGRRQGDNIYKTAPDVTKIEAPWIDPHMQNKNPPTQLFEFYTP